MSDDTPSEELEGSAIAELAPRLTVFIEQFIEQLKSKGYTVDVGPTYLLDDSAHQVDVPYKVNNIPLEMRFSASLNAWSHGPRARVRVCVGGRDGRTYVERHPRPDGIHAKKILSFIATELKAIDSQSTRKYEDFVRVSRAKDAFAQLAADFHLQVTDKPEYSVMGTKNIRIRSAPGHPRKVVLLAIVSHNQAAEILRAYSCDPDKVGEGPSCTSSLSTTTSDEPSGSESDS